MLPAIRRGARPRVTWSLLILLALCALFVAACGSSQVGGTTATATTSTGLQGTDLGMSPAPDFHLSDQNHQAISLAQFRGMPVILTFFYTHCTTTCPLIATKIHTALVQLGPTAQHVAILAISVDPSGDTPANAVTFAQEHQLQGYRYWHYLLGTRQELTPVWASYAVSGIPAGASTMSQGAMQHSAVVYLLDQQGRERILFDATFPPAQLANDIHLLLTGHS